MQVNLVISVQENRENTFELSEVQDKQILMSLKYNVQAFRFMVGPGHCPMIPKYGPSLFKAAGAVDPSFLFVKKSHFNKNIHLTASLLHRTKSTCRLSIQ